VDRHRKLLLNLGVLLVAGVVFVVLWFEPHKLFIEETVNEALPTSEPTVEERSSTSADDETDEPRVLAAGSFSSLEHETTGDARIVEIADGRRFLRFEGLSTSNGPDLRVYLSEIPASDDWYAYGERYVDLGELKANLGDQNYEIPEGLDLSRFESAVIWCRRFTVGFGVAGLS
jgi:hypothetical protein